MKYKYIKSNYILVQWNYQNSYIKNYKEILLLYHKLLIYTCDHFGYTNKYIYLFYISKYNKKMINLIVQLLFTIILLKVLDFFIITPLRLRHFYRNQGINCDYWNPLHFIKIIYEGQKHNDPNYSCKKMIIDNPNCNG